MQAAVTAAAGSSARRSAEALERVGLEPVLLPCIRIEPGPRATLDRVREECQRADLILVTSPRTIQVLWPHGHMPSVPVAVVGTATAAAVTEAGGTIETVGSGGVDTLIEVLGPQMSGQRVVYPHSAAAPPGAPTRLKQAGARPHTAPVYATTPISPGDDPVDAVLFGSPSAVAGWCTARSLDGLVIAAIGDTTLAALRSQTDETVIVPDRPGYEHMAAAVAQHLEKRSPT